MDYVIRFLAGGAIVSIFAVVGDVLRPKSFAGLFGAAPSVALVTLALAFWRESPAFVAIEARSMVAGAVALALYSVVVCQAMMRARSPAIYATVGALAFWLAVALGLQHLFAG